MEKKRKFIFIIAVVGMIGTFLPWASIAGFVTVSGTEGDGWITFALFAIGGAIAFFSGEKTEAIKKKITTVIWIPAAIAAIIALINVFKLSHGFSAGFGLWLVIIAGFAQVFVSFFFKGESGWNIPKSMADVKAAASIPSAKDEAAPAEPAVPAEPATPAAPESPEAPSTEEEEVKE
ncbi:MAG: hypothetical protein K8S24_01170 [Candidatus Aegiribacteria sp.]|nr:hypothetical protein [Candidatus Aegiribacteria sp.]